MGFNVNIEVQMSKGMKVMGAIGHLVSMKKTSPSVSPKAVGESGTSAWKICGIDPQTTFGFYFSVVNQDQMPKRNQRGLIQFTTSYMDSSGAHILRVTTIGRPFVTAGVPGQQDPGAMVDPNPKAALSAGFDQEAVAVLLARMAVFKTREESPFDVIRWLDRTLINVTQQFGEFVKGDASSFRLGRSFGLLPQFMFHLRRSCLLQNFNNSPDESTYYRFMCLRETCPNSMTMIQPRLEAYTMQEKGFPVLLSSTSLAPDRILMLDTFFHLVIWHGKTISDWKAKGYQNDPNYGSFRQLLESPQEDAKFVLDERIPTPMFKSCAHNHGDARYLLAVIDPAMTYSSNAGGMQHQGGEVIPTDDANLQVFVEHLAKLTVQNN
jgi:protein transport protein SEC23